MENINSNNSIDTNSYDNDNWKSETFDELGNSTDLSSEITNNAFKNDFGIDDNSLIHSSEKTMSKNDIDELNKESVLESALEDELKEEDSEEDSEKNSELDNILLTFKQMLKENIKLKENINKIQFQYNQDKERSNSSDNSDVKISNSSDNSDVKISNSNDNSDLVQLLISLLQQKTPLANGIKESVIGTSPNGSIAEGIANILNGVGSGLVNVLRKSVTAVANQFNVSPNKLNEFIPESNKSLENEIIDKDPILPLVNTVPSNELNKITPESNKPLENAVIDKDPILPPVNIVPSNKLNKITPESNKPLENAVIDKDPILPPVNIVPSNELNKIIPESNKPLENAVIDKDPILPPVNIPGTITSNFKYRLEQLMNEQASYSQNVEKLWSLPEFNEIYNRIGEIANQSKLTNEEVISKINSDNEFKEISNEFNNILSSSPEAKQIVDDMEENLKKWQKYHEVLAKNFGDLDSDNNEVQEAFNNYQNSTEAMQKAAKKVPKTSEFEQSHFDKLMEYMEMIKEMIKEMALSVKHFLHKLVKNSNDDENENVPSI